MVLAAGPTHLFFRSFVATKILEYDHFGFVGEGEIGNLAGNLPRRIRVEMADFLPQEHVVWDILGLSPALGTFRIDRIEQQMAAVVQRGAVDKLCSDQLAMEECAHDRQTVHPQVHGDDR